MITAKTRIGITTGDLVESHGQLGMIIDITGPFTMSRTFYDPPMADVYTIVYVPIELKERRFSRSDHLWINGVQQSTDGSYTWWGEPATFFRIIPNPDPPVQAYNLFELVEADDE